MKAAFLAVFVLASTWTAAQSWCPPGARWVCAGRLDLSPTRDVYAYTGDTLIGGVTAQKVVRTVTVLDQSGLTHPPVTEVTMNAGNVVWMRANDAWDTLYWFGAGPGDRWWPIGADESCPPRGILEVSGTTTEVIDGVALRVLDVCQLDADGSALQCMTIRERLGGVPRVPDALPCNGHADPFFFETALLCYSDDRISWPGPGPCDLHVGTGPIPMNAGLTLRPDPADGALLVSIHDGRSLERVEIQDAAGRTVLVYRTSGVTSRIPINALPPGLYVARVQAAGGLYAGRFLNP